MPSGELHRDAGDVFSVLSARKGTGEAEGLEGVVLEAGHGRDVVAVEGEDVEASSVAGAVRGPEVGAEGRLAVGAGWDQVESAAGAEEGRAELADDFVALVLEGERRHGHEDVVGEERDEGVDVGGLPGLDEARDEGVLGG